MLRSWKKFWLIGAGIATLVLAIFAITGQVLADSNNPGVINPNVVYDPTLHTLTVTGTSNCAKHQPMGIAFFAVRNATTALPGTDTIRLDIPDATVDVLTVTSSTVAALGVGVDNRVYSPGVTSFATSCSANLAYGVTLAAGAGSPNELDTRPDFLCNVEYHLKNKTADGTATNPANLVNGENVQADGAKRDPDNSVETNGFNYSAAANTTACVGIPFPALSIHKTADAVSVDNGSPIGFTIKADNTGNSAATSTAIDDDLPDGTGITWSVKKASATNANCVATGGIAASSCNVVGFTGASTCSIVAGTVTAQALHCDIGTVPANTPAPGTFVVHVTSPTTRDSADCPNGATYDNTATIDSADQPGSPDDQSTASETVNCASTTLDKHVAAASDVKITATYTYDENNNGSVDLHNISVADNQCGTSHGDAANPTYASGDDGDGLLNPGETWTFTCTHTYTLTTNPQDFTNIGTGSGTSPLNHVVTDCGNTTPGTRICNSAESDTTTIHVAITVGAP